MPREQSGPSQLPDVSMLEYDIMPLILGDRSLGLRGARKLGKPFFCSLFKLTGLFRWRFPRSRWNTWMWMPVIYLGGDPRKHNKGTKGRDSEAGTQVPALGPVGTAGSPGREGRQWKGRSGRMLPDAPVSPPPQELPGYQICPATATGWKAPNRNVMYFRNTSVHTRGAHFICSNRVTSHSHVQ